MSSHREKELANIFKNTAIGTFIASAGKKYDKGQAEHGGFLVDKVTFEDIQQELIDAWFYVCAMQAKVGRETVEPKVEVRMLDSLSPFERMVRAEKASAQRKFDPMVSVHQGWGILEEEVFEVRAEVFKRDRSKTHLLMELVQVAAVAQRMAEDLSLIEIEGGTR